MKIIAANICKIRYLSELNLSIEYAKQELSHRGILTVCNFQPNKIKVIYHGEKENIETVLIAVAANFYTCFSLQRAAGDRGDSF